MSTQTLDADDTVEQVDCEELAPSDDEIRLQQLLVIRPFPLWLHSASLLTTWAQDLSTAAAIQKDQAWVSRQIAKLKMKVGQRGPRGARGAPSPPPPLPSSPSP